MNWAAAISSWTASVAVQPPAKPSWSFTKCTEPRLLIRRCRLRTVHVGLGPGRDGRDRTPHDRIVGLREPDRQEMLASNVWAARKPRQLHRQLHTGGVVPLGTCLRCRGGAVRGHSDG